MKKNVKSKRVEVTLGGITANGLVQVTYGHLGTAVNPVHWVESKIGNGMIVFSESATYDDVFAKEQKAEQELIVELNNVLNYRPNFTA